MTPPNNDHQATPAQALHLVSISLQRLGVCLQELYLLPNLTDENITDLNTFRANLQDLQRQLGESRALLLAKPTHHILSKRQELEDVVARLDRIVARINQLNELLEIAGQVAAIAAGLAA